MPPRFRFDRTFRFDATVDELWEAIADTRSFPAIWSWLRDFEAGPLEPGTFATFKVQPPLPYSLRFEVQVVELRAREHVRAHVKGDADGTAELAVAPTESGSRARLTWDLALVKPSLRRLTPVLRPVMVGGHDAVVAIGVRQFRKKALTER